MLIGTQLLPHVLDAGKDTTGSRRYFMLIGIQLCPLGTLCWEGHKWIPYVLDADRDTIGSPMHLMLGGTQLDPLGT